ncbi:unnamed protein product [Closterium sp. NIES-64]|nr:unnamed protein product [Closterium sp. NIES-64]
MAPASGQKEATEGSARESAAASKPPLEQSPKLASGGAAGEATTNSAYDFSDPTAEGDWRFDPQLEWQAGVRAYLSQAYGAERFERICTALSRPPLSVCLRVNPLRTTTEDALIAVAGALGLDPGGGGRGGGGEKAEAKSREGTWGSEREERKGETTVADADCDSDAGNVASARLVCREHPLVPGVIIVEGTGPHRVSYEPVEQSKGSSSGGGGGGDGRGRVEESERGAAGKGEGGEGEKGKEGREGKEQEGVKGDDRGRESEGRMEQMKQVVVSRKCGEAVLRGANVFVPGVLACSPGVEAGDTVAVCVAIEARVDGMAAEGEAGEVLRGGTGRGGS